MDGRIMIVSPKKEGNTYKVAKYLQERTEAELFVIENGGGTELKQYEHIFVCSGVYGDKIHKSLSVWMNGLKRKDLHENVRFHVFLTWFGRGASDRHAMNEAVRILEGKGIPYNESYGSCFGGMFFIRKGHPNDADLQNALAWMQSQVK